MACFPEGLLHRILRIFQLQSWWVRSRLQRTRWCLIWSCWINSLLNQILSWPLHYLLGNLLARLAFGHWLLHHQIHCYHCHRKPAWRWSHRKTTSTAPQLAPFRHGFQRSCPVGKQSDVLLSAVWCTTTSLFLSNVIRLRYSVCDIDSCSLMYCFLVKK